MTDCSLCGLCVRYCAEIKKENALYWKGRGIDRRPALLDRAHDQCARNAESASRFAAVGGW